METRSPDPYPINSTPKRFVTAPQLSSIIVQVHSGTSSASDDHELPLSDPFTTSAPLTIAILSSNITNAATIIQTSYAISHFSRQSRGSRAASDRSHSSVRSLSPIPAFRRIENDTVETRVYRASESQHPSKSNRAEAIGGCTSEEFLEWYKNKSSLGKFLWQDSPERYLTSKLAISGYGGEGAVCVRKAGSDGTSAEVSW